MDVRRKLLPVLLIAAGSVVYFSLAPGWPVDQHVRVVLGDASPRVDEVTLRFAKSHSSGGGDWLREVTFHYAKGGAPRIVSYEPRLASGEYLLEIEIRTEDSRVVTNERHVDLTGGTTSIELPQPSALREGRLP